MKSLYAVTIMVGMFLFGTNYALAQQPYNLTVNAPFQIFNSSVIAKVITKDGYITTPAIITGNASHTFSIPANEGNAVEVCISHDIYAWSV